MKNLKKLMVVALMLAGVSGKIAAYTFKITNNTGQDVKVKLFWGVGSPLNKRYDEIKRGKTRKFAWKFGSLKAGLCLSGIKVQNKVRGRWEKEKKVKLVRGKVDFSGVGGGAGAILFDIIAYKCGNQNFDLVINDEKTGKIVAVKK